MPLLILLTSISHLGEDYAAGEVVDTVEIGMGYGEARDLIQNRQAELV
jgi:hypothetical protein